MKLLQTMVTLVMVALWPLAVMHCKLETAPGLEFLRCAADSEGNADCQDDGCKTVEEVAYKVRDQQKFVPKPVILPAQVFVPALEVAVVDEPPSLLSRVPPELPKRWQFASRAAPSARAPSVVS